MAPPIDNQNKPLSDEMRRAIEAAKEMARQPLRLSAEDRREIKRGVLLAMGRDDADD